MADWGRGQNAVAMEDMLDVENKRMADSLASKVTRLKSICACPPSSTKISSEERQRSILVPACHAPTSSRNETVWPCVEARISLMFVKSVFLLLGVSYPSRTTLHWLWILIKTLMNKTDTWTAWIQIL
ncbi:BET1-like protein isoform X1 [Phasianus colchicus]|uniref:BET1-like protein isoform X1 n=1 Tax=Phasianus colchicus TaxID=9054 RepID=UPI00129DB0CC|nr:BET1-like protein isoform X1 [Phasianus colchicus]